MLINKKRKIRCDGELINFFKNVNIVNPPKTHNLEKLIEIAQVQESDSFVGNLSAVVFVNDGKDKLLNGYFYITYKCNLRFTQQGYFESIWGDDYYRNNIESIYYKKTLFAEKVFLNRFEYYDFSLQRVYVPIFSIPLEKI